MASTDRGLYAITRQTSDTGSLLAWVDAVIAGGAVWLQYRDKGHDPEHRLRQAMALADRCRAANVRLIINDDARLARACAADGVHLGENDGDIQDARELLGPDCLIGVSCYDDLERARRLCDAGADYLAFGAFFPSPTKPDARRVMPDLLTEARELHRPLVAIGGITPDNGAALVHAGADLIAVISGLGETPDEAFLAARRYAALFDDHPLPIPPS